MALAQCSLSAAWVDGRRTVRGGDCRVRGAAGEPSGSLADLVEFGRKLNSVCWRLEHWLVWRSPSVSGAVLTRCCPIHRVLPGLGTPRSTTAHDFGGLGRVTSPSNVLIRSGNHGPERYDRHHHRYARVAMGQQQLAHQRHFQVQIPKPGCRCGSTRSAATPAVRARGDPRQGLSRSDSRLHRA